MSYQPNFTTLSAEEMVGVSTTFQESFFHTMTAFTSSEHLPVIIKFLAELVTSYQPSRAASIDGRNRLVTEIYGSAPLADFVTRLTSVFYSRLGSNQEVEGLIGNLARGASLFIPEQEKQGSLGDPVRFSMIPKEVTQRFSTTSELITVLTQNGWLVSVLCVCLYISLPQLARKQ